MYKTIKLRLVSSGEQKQYLLEYEKVYHKQLTDVVTTMLQEGKTQRFKKQLFVSDIPKASQWLLYKLAISKYEYYQKHHDWSYLKSSSWSPKSVQLKDRQITFLFHNRRKEGLRIACEKDEWEYLIHGTIIRIDLVHDETYWFVNFLISYKSDSISK